jgi:hypothetical protein
MREAEERSLVVVSRSRHKIAFCVLPSFYKTDFFNLNYKN